jgi:hypothetical protein
MRIYNINGNLTVVDSDTTAERIYPGQWTYLYDTTPVVAWSDPSLDPQYHWIDTGPWRDRFGIDWLAITSSSNELCKAAAQLWIDRKYINLKDARNAQVLDAMIATSQPAANVLFDGSGPMTVDKKNAILNPVTTEYERHVKGMVQPS